jgi:hypothetical protein
MHHFSSEVNASMGAAGTALAATDGSEPLIDPLSEESGVGFLLAKL